MSTDPNQPQHSLALYDNAPAGEVFRITRQTPSHSSHNLLNREQANMQSNMEQKKTENSGQDKGQNYNLQTSTTPLKRESDHRRSSLSSPNSNTKKMLNPLRIDEKIYADKYHEALEQQAGFHKNSGFFTQFASRNKILNDQYKSERAQSNVHSRYISKPVLFTALNTKNRLSQIGIVDHSQILRETKMGEIKSSLLTVTPRDPLNKDERIDSPTVGSPGKSGSTPLLLSLDNERKMNKEKLSPIKTAKEAIDYSPYSTKHSKQHVFSAKTLDELKINPAKTKLSICKDQKSISAFTTNSQASFSNGRFTDYGSPIKCFSSKSRPTFQSPTNSKTFQEISRYHTKVMADSLLNQYTERSKKVDPIEYLEHSQDVDFMRSTTIAIGLLEQDKKYSKKHVGGLEAYSTKNKITNYQEPGTLEAIGKFEENIIGWTKSVPNFGKQRWTYEKDWEFRLI